MLKLKEAEHQVLFIAGDLFYGSGTYIAHNGIFMLESV